jgi:hypothetical protein
MSSKENDIQERRRIRARRRKAQEERFPQSKSPEQLRQERFALPSRATILGIVDARTRPTPLQNKLVFELKHREVLTKFIDARIAKANGDNKPLDDFMANVTSNTDTFNPEISSLADDLNLHFHIVLDAFPKKHI